MAEAFLGLKISVLLSTGLRVEGVVSHLEPSTQQMTLTDAALLFPGQPPHYTPVYGVVGKDIEDLQVLAAAAAAAAPPPPAQEHQPKKALDNHLLDNETFHQPKAVTPVKTVSKSKLKNSPLPNHVDRKPKQQQQQQQQLPKRNEGWAVEDVNIFKEQEFDFQKNLDMFDKAKEFAKIRESDETAPEQLLVTLNRLPQKPVNLLPTENVLDHERTAYHDIDEHHEPTSIVTANEGIVCPTVSPRQMAHVLHECSHVSSSFQQLWIENAGRGTALLVLQKMEAPTVVILAGNNTHGAIGLVAARHLVNHGCGVTVCITANDDDYVQTYVRMAEKFGVHVRYDLVDGADVIVDAMLGPEETSIEEHVRAIEWANRQRTPILSIDFPSGIDADTGMPHHPKHMIHPKWTICLGAPKTGCKSSQLTGDLYLVDIGIPRLCWKRVGVKGNTIPWGADFLVALVYDIVY